MKLPPKAFLVLALLLLSGSAAFYFFGRSVWHPVLVKIRGERSVAEVVGELRIQTNIDFEAENWKRLFLIGLKEERTLEVWGVDQTGVANKLRDFPFTGFSGSLGPKLKEGDGQIPEGIYRIESLNPNSSYHLSMKLDYPNDFDRRMGKADGRDQLGSNIFIHGKSATIGCIPIGDEAIEELFFMVAEIGVGNVDVILAPYDSRYNSKTLEIPKIAWEEVLYSQINNKIREMMPPNH